MMNKYVILLLLSVVIASASQILLKKSAMKKYDTILQEYLNPLVIIGYGLMFVSLVVTMLAYGELEYKNGPVIESTSYLLIMFLSAIFFKEKITKKKVIGNAIILLGIFVFYL